MYNENLNASFGKKISKVSFFVFVFVSIFGTSLPFREHVIDASAISRSNLINQLIYGILFLMSFIALLSKKSALILFIKKEKFITLFIFWCMLSIFWSQFGFVSFKRLFQVITAVLVSSAYLLHSDSSEESLSFFKFLFSTYILLSLFAVLMIPEAKQPNGALWRGISSHKNQLGQIALISSVFWWHFLRVDRAWRQFLAFILFLSSVVLLAGSRSMTSIITFGALVSVASVLYIDNRLRTIGIGRSFLSLVIVTTLLVGTTIIVLAPDLISALPEYLGKDITFTGRSELWTDVLNISKNHLLLGCGFGGFWNVDSVLLLDLYDKYPFLPKTAHNGYLDLFNETGLIGLTIIMFMVFSYFKEFLKMEKPHFWVWPLACILILNLTESALFVQGVFSGNIFIFAYLSMYADLLSTQQNGHTQAMHY